MKGFNASRILALSLAAGLLAASCKSDYAPKPRGYYRIDLPGHEYLNLEGNYPYSFDYPVYATVRPYQGTWTGSDTSAYWINLDFARFGSHIHLTYKKIQNNLAQLVEDSHTYAYKHSVKADAIRQTEYLDPDRKVFGLLFDIRGNTASSVQFYLTDSVSNFLRGALYFDCIPNKDSLAPVVEFLRADMVRLIETLQWKANTD